MSNTIFIYEYMLFIYKFSTIILIKHVFFKNLCFLNYNKKILLKKVYFFLIHNYKKIA
jgi:hypothetical protein